MTDEELRVIEARAKAKPKLLDLADLGGLALFRQAKLCRERGDESEAAEWEAKADARLDETLGRGK